MNAYLRTTDGAAEPHKALPTLAAIMEKPENVQMENQGVTDPEKRPPSVVAAYENDIDPKAERRLLLKLDAVILPLTVLMVGLATIHRLSRVVQADIWSTSVSQREPGRVSPPTPSLCKGIADSGTV